MSLSSKKIRFNPHPEKDIEKQVDNLINKEQDQDIPDIIQEQIEASDTSIHCPESITEENLKNIKKNPERYIEINMVKKIRIVDTFYIPSNLKNFNYKDKTYNIKEDFIYLLPTKSGYIMPTSFYYEFNKDPTSFKQTNTGITGKALSLLYNENLYMDLFSGDESRYNLFIVILLIASMISYAIGLYILFGGELPAG